MKAKKLSKIKIKTIGNCKMPYYSVGSNLGLNIEIPSRIYLVNHQHKPGDSGGVRVDIKNLVFPPNSYTALPTGVIIDSSILIYNIEYVTNLRVCNYIYEGNDSNELFLVIHNPSNNHEHWMYESPIVKFIKLDQPLLTIEGV